MDHYRHLPSTYHIESVYQIWNTIHSFHTKVRYQKLSRVFGQILTDFWDNYRIRYKTNFISSGGHLSGTKRTYWEFSVMKEPKFNKWSK